MTAPARRQRRPIRCRAGAAATSAAATASPPAISGDRRPQDVPNGGQDGGRERGRQGEGEERERGGGTVEQRALESDAQRRARFPQHHHAEPVAGHEGQDLPEEERHGGDAQEGCDAGHRGAVTAHRGHDHPPPQGHEGDLERHQQHGSREDPRVDGADAGGQHRRVDQAADEDEGERRRGQLEGEHRPPPEGASTLGEGLLGRGRPLGSDGGRAAVVALHGDAVKPARSVGKRGSVPRPFNRPVGRNRPAALATAAEASRRDAWPADAQAVSPP